MAHISQFPDRSEDPSARQRPKRNFFERWTDAPLQPRFGMSDQGLMWLPTPVINDFFKS
jgi:hypothetical protein